MFNLAKKYNGLLEIMGMSPNDRNKSLYGVFKRDIEDNPAFYFRTKTIRPVKKEDGLTEMERLFDHLVCQRIIVTNPDGTKYKRKEFERDRSERLHWIWFHVQESVCPNRVVFSHEERDQNRRVDVIKTYIYDIQEKYVIVLLPQTAQRDYVLLSAHYLNKPGAERDLQKKLRRCLPDIH